MGLTKGKEVGQEALHLHRNKSPSPNRPASQYSFSAFLLGSLSTERESWLLVLPRHCHLGVSFNKVTNNPSPNSVY